MAAVYPAYSVALGEVVRTVLLVQNLFRQSGGCEGFCMGREVRARLLQETRLELSNNGKRHIKRRSAHACGACLPAEYENRIVSSRNHALDNKPRIGSPLVGTLGPAARAVGPGERSLDSPRWS